MPKGKGKQRKRVRKRRWDADRDIDATSREPRKVRGRETGVGAPVERGLDLSACFTDIEPNGIVVSPYGVLAFVEVDGREMLCRVGDELTDGRTSILAPGDLVRVETGEDEPVVTAVKHRRNKLSRPGSFLREREQVFAANIDQLVVVASVAEPFFKPGVVERYLIAAQVGGVDPVVAVNKMDLAEEPPAEVELYRELDIPVFLTSVATGQGIDELRDALRGKRSILSGQSGVGKSSLLKALAPHLDLRIQEVSQTTQKGRHTTTASRLYHLDDGIDIIDTPGVKQLGLWGVSSEELDYYFPALADYAGQCKFRDCTHTHEPGCAIQAAVESGDLSRGWYDSYLRIRNSMEQGG